MNKRVKGIFGKGGSIVRISIAGIIIAVLIVSFYYYLSHRFSSNEETYEAEVPSELEIVMNKDFINEYPETPRKVIEWYNRILKLYYSDDVGDREIEVLCDQARMLFDQRILDANSRKNFIAAVKQEKADYKARNKHISSATIVNDIERSQGRDDLAAVSVLYTVQEQGTFESFYQTYNLKRDGAGKYKIYSFALTDADGNPRVGSVGSLSQ